MRTIAIAWTFLATAGLATLGGCADSKCPDETFEQDLVVTVDPADCPEGAHVLRGTADGVPFSCELDCRADSIVPGGCEGGAVVQPMVAGDPTVAVKLAGKPDEVVVELAAAGAVEPLRRRELVGGPVSGCAGDESWNAIKEPTCTDGLKVKLPSRLSGGYEFEGTADGTAFRCTYTVVQLGPEANEVRDAACDVAAVSLSIDHYRDDYSAYDAVRAVFPAGPAVVAWSFTATSESGRATDAGTLAPTYAFDGGGCRVAGGEVP